REEVHVAERSAGPGPVAQQMCRVLRGGRVLAVEVGWHAEPCRLEEIDRDGLEPVGDLPPEDGREFPRAATWSHAVALEVLEERRGPGDGGGRPRAPPWEPAAGRGASRPASASRTG